MKDHDHKEAFALMQYECEKCNHAEMLWNSRDGVTPFCINCRKCEGVMRHVRFYQDIYAPEFKPPNGMRIFVDAKSNNPEIVSEARSYVEEWWDKKSKWGGGTMREVMAGNGITSMEQAVTSFVKEWSGEGSPSILEVGGPWDYGRT